MMRWMRTLYYEVRIISPSIAIASMMPYKLFLKTSMKSDDVKYY